MLFRKCHLLFSLLTLLFLRNTFSAMKDVHIPVLIPMYGFQYDRFACLTAMKYAFELINNHSDILSDYHLVPEYYDTVGDTPTSLYIITKVMEAARRTCTNVPPVVIGPAFSRTTIPVGGVLKYHATVQVSYGATSPVLDDRAAFPFLVRTTPSTSTYNRGYIALMKKFGWRRVGIFYDHKAHDGIFNKNTENLIKHVKNNNFTVVGIESVDASPSSLATSDYEIQERLKKLKAADIKIFFGQFRWVGAYRIFCQVYKLGMYGKDYVWIIHSSVDTVNQWMTAGTRYKHIKTDCTEEQYRKVSERMLSMDKQEFRLDSETTISRLTAVEYNNYVSLHRLRKPEDFLFHNTSFHAYAFDAVWVAALALNKSIPELKKHNITLDKLICRGRVSNQVKAIKRSFFDINFEGVTGPIHFDQKHEDSVGTVTLRQTRGDKFVSLGKFEAINEKLYLDQSASKDMWIDGYPPSDISHRRTILLNIPLTLYLPACTVAGLGIIFALGVLIFNIYNRNERYIKKSAPMFNNIIIFGIMISLSTVAYFGLPVKLGETDKFLMSCKLRSWVLCLGFSLSFGTMFVKTWRVYKIFTNRKLKYSIDRLSNTSLFVIIISIVFVDLFILILWEFLDPMEVKINNFPKQVDPEDSNMLLVPILYTCYSSHQDTWITTIYTIKGILLLYGLFLAYETRNVQFDHLNDSRMIGVCVYNVAVMSILGGLLRIILSVVYYKESFGITAVCIVFPSLGTLFLIFLPKGKRLILGIDPTPNGYSRVVRFVKNSAETSEIEIAADGIVIEDPGSKTGQFRKDSVSSGMTSASSSLPCSNSRIMPIYEEAVSPAAEDPSNGVVSPTENGRSSVSTA